MERKAVRTMTEERKMMEHRRFLVGREETIPNSVVRLVEDVGGSCWPPGKAGGMVVEEEHRVVV